MASRGVNKVIIVGNLGGDPEVRYTQDSTAIANITVATSESWKDKNTGEQKEVTEWHRVVFYRRLAEIVGEYLKKGSKVYIEGRLQTRKWQDQSGNDKYTTEIVANELQMLDSKPQGTGQQQQQSGYQQQQRPPVSGTNAQQPNPQAQGGYQQQPAQNQAPASSNDIDSEIPF